VTNNEPQPEDVGANPASTSQKKTRRALAGLKRELTDEELASPGTQKMILEELERLSEENLVLTGLRQSFHKVDKDLAVLQEKHKRFIAAEIVSGACIAAGAASLGFAPAVWSSAPGGYIALAFGVLLTLGGVVAKAIKL